MPDKGLLRYTPEGLLRHRHYTRSCEGVAQYCLGHVAYERANKEVAADLAGRGGGWGKQGDRRAGPVVGWCPSEVLLENLSFLSSTAVPITATEVPARLTLETAGAEK